MAPQSAARWWRLSGVRCAWNRPTYGKAPPYRGQVQGLTWQGETEPGARAERQGSMRMLARARADCPRALRIESALRLRHREQNHYASTAQNALECACPSFWHKSQTARKNAHSEFRQGKNGQFCKCSLLRPRKSPLHCIKQGGRAVVPGAGGWITSFFAGTPARPDSRKRQGSCSQRWQRA